MKVCTIPPLSGWPAQSIARARTEASWVGTFAIDRAQHSHVDRRFKTDEFPWIKGPGRSPQNQYRGIPAREANKHRRIRAAESGGVRGTHISDSSEPCGIPSTAQAFALNMTAVPQGALGFLSAWPTGQGYPGVSTLNSTNGNVIANAAIIPSGTGGAITVVAANPTDLIIDIVGYFAP